MSKQDWHRFWLHFPVGCLCSMLVDKSEWQGILLTFIFVAYEILNDWRKHDSSYKDVFGFAFGFGTVAIILYLLEILAL